MSIPAMNRDFVIDDFINRVRAGHCEFFASAMALMLRSQGIPTRVVSGYRGGEWSESDGAYIVRKSMAHLWVEVLFPDLGWIRFDPAPREDYTPPTGIQALINSLQRTALNLQVFWFQEVVGFDRGLTLDRLRDVSLRLFGWEGDQEEGTVAPGEPTGPPAPYYLRTIPAPLFIFGWLALMTGLVWGLLRRRKQATGLSPDQQRASRLYRQLVRRLERLGIPHDSRTAEELIEAIADYPVVDPKEGAELVAIYNEVRFGGRRLTAERFTELRKRIRAIDAT
jgi:hypothetical protein